MSHMDEGTLHAWLDRDRSGLSAAERTEIEAHLEACAFCSSQLEEARLVRERATLILAKAPPVVPPDFSELRRRAETRTSRPRRHRWVPGAWAASLVIALGVGWVGRDLIRGGSFTGGSGSAPVAVDVAVGVGAGAEVAMAPDVVGPQPAAEAAPGPEPVNFGSGIQDLPPPPAAGPAAPGNRTVEAPPVAVAASAARAAAPTPPASILNLGDLVIRGRVTQPDGEPLGAVQLSVAGSGAGTLTDADGTYSFTLRREALANLQEGLTLEARRLGFQAVRTELVRGATDTIGADLQLAPTVLALQEIVASGLVDPVDGARSPIAVGVVQPPDALNLWRPVERSEAEAALGAPLVAVPELPILAYEVGRREDGPLVRILQELEEGVLTLTLRRVPPAGAARPSDGPTASAVRMIGALEVAASGSLSAEALQALLARVR